MTILLGTVRRVIDGDTFVVDQMWYWNNQSGSIIRPIGYDAPEIDTARGIAAGRWLTELLLGKEVLLDQPVDVDRGRLVCRVHFQGRDLRHHYWDWDRSSLPSLMRYAELTGRT